MSIKVSMLSESRGVFHFRVVDSRFLKSATTYELKLTSSGISDGRILMYKKNEHEVKPGPPFNMKDPKDVERLLAVSDSLLELVRGLTPNFSVVGERDESNRMVKSTLQACIKAVVSSLDSGANELDRMNKTELGATLIKRVRELESLKF